MDTHTFLSRNISSYEILQIYKKYKINKSKFRMMIVKMIQDLRKRIEAKIEKMQEMFTKDLEELKNKETEMNNTLEGIRSRITEAEERINDWEDRMVETTTTEQNIEKRMRINEYSLRDQGEH